MLCMCAVLDSSLVPIHCRSTCSFEQQKATHTSREAVRVTYRKKRTPKHNKNEFVNEKN